MSERTDMERKFQNVKWNKHVCGAGSLYENTGVTRKTLLAVIQKYNIASMSDAGAGDLSWISTMNLGGVIDYKPYDLVPRHEDVTKFDITSEILPKTDLILCRYVLNHIFKWPELEQAAMNNFIKSGSRFILCTYMPEHNSYYNDIWGDPLEEVIDKYKSNGTPRYLNLWRLNDD